MCEVSVWKAEMLVAISDVCATVSSLVHSGGDAADDVETIEEEIRSRMEWLHDAYRVISAETGINKGPRGKGRGVLTRPPAWFDHRGYDVRR